MASNNYANDDDLIYNTSSRIPVCICIDTSGSMWQTDNSNYSRIQRVQHGLEKFYNEIESNEMTRNSAEILIVGFSSTPYIIRNFKTYTPGEEQPQLTCHSKGDMGLGVSESLQKLIERKDMYKANGIDYYQPWLIIMSDGHSTGDGDVQGNLKRAQAEVLKLEKENKITVIPVYIGKDLASDQKAKKELSGFSRKYQPINILDIGFSKFFVWLGKSVSVVNTNEDVQLDFADLTDWDEI